MTMLKTIFRLTQCGLLLALMAAAASGADSSADAQSVYGQWKNGPPTDPKFFPIAVWLQSPKNAALYKAAGINTYVALWRGPTQEQLRALQETGMRVICSQNSMGLSNKDNATIIGWMHGDEPDNAQARPGQKGYGPPIVPETIVTNYNKLRVSDPTRPVLLNLGQGVAWDNYIGRGVRRNHPEDYANYIKGCDIASFDIYPAVHSDPAIGGKLEYVSHGVDRLLQWGDGKKLAWNCIECSRISNTTTKPTAEQIRTEVWMSLIHGSRGLIYFVHQFKPTFQEASLLEDKELLQGVTALNRQIQELAPVLNSGTITNAVEVRSSAKDVPISSMMKRYGGAIHLFAVNMRNEATHGTFKMHDAGPDKAVEVLHETRKLMAKGGEFADDFAPYAVHLYRGLFQNGGRLVDCARPVKVASSSKVVARRRASTFLFCRKAR